MNRLLGACLVTAIALVPPPASAATWDGMAAAADSALAAFDVCYATIGNAAANAGALIRINLATGAGTLIGPTGIVGERDEHGVPALAIRSNGLMYALGIGNSANLYLVSAKTGAATLVGATGLASPPAMVFDGFGVLNATDNNGLLYTLDPATAAATLVGPTGVQIRGLAVDPTDGWLWGSDTGGRVYKIDGQTGVATLVGSTGQSPSPDLSFDRSGVLYAVSGGGLAANNLISIDKSSGAGTVIGPIGFTSVSGMAMRLDHIVPALVQGHSSRWLGRGVELRWRLADAAGSLAFEIDRAQGAGGYVRLDASGVSLDGADFVFLDAAVEPGRTYRYRVAVLEEGRAVTSFETLVTVPSLAAALEQNHPNPFRAQTRIAYVTHDATRVTLTVHDAAGRLVRTLVDDRPVDAGAHVETWDGRDARGAPVGGGVYFCRLRWGDHVLTRRMTRLD